MLLEAEEGLYIQPQQSIKISEYLIQNSDEDSTVIKAYLLKGRALYVSGQFEAAVIATMEAKDLSEKTENIELQFEITLFGIHLLKLLDLDLAAERYLSFTQVFSKDAMTTKNELYLEGGTALIKAIKATEQDKYLEVLTYLSKAKSILKKIPSEQTVNDIEIDEIETYLKALPPLDAKAKLGIVLKELNDNGTKDFQKMIVLNQLGIIQFQNKNNSEAIKVLDTALKLSEKLKNPFYKHQIVENLALNYMVLEDSENFKFYKNIGNSLTSELAIDEDKAVNTVFNYTSTNHTAKRDLVESNYQRNILVLGIVLLCILATWLFLKIRYRSRIKQYSNFILFFEARQKKKEAPTLSKKEVSRSLNIPKETEDILIKKLSKFEQSTLFTKNDMSIALLASQFSTNTKYLSEIINTQKNKNFNSYINDLRINYIIDKLTTNATYLQYKISYLAEESGFSSHSSFATVFKSVTGIAPTVFIDVLKSNKNSILSLQEVHNE
ncbi:helix-turn-helix domain-containing protein [Ulvibacter antarcticus]|nr:helix-turn-helix domain-containing protein [Ulvibacter antarcticus]